MTMTASKPMGSGLYGLLEHSLLGWLALCLPLFLLP